MVDGPGLESTATKPSTVFPRSDAVATIYFVLQVLAATIRGRRLLEGGVYNTILDPEFITS